MKKRRRTLKFWMVLVLLLLAAGFIAGAYTYFSEIRPDSREAKTSGVQKEQTKGQKKPEKNADIPENISQKTESVQENKVKGIVAIDPGHQGSWVDMSELEPVAPGSDVMKAKASTGTQGRFTGINEYELNLDISLMLEKELKNRGYQIVMTRRDHDTAISNAERAALANESGADFLIRIHANGSDDTGASGALALAPGADNHYVGHLSEQSMELAGDILNSYCGATGMGSVRSGGLFSRNL